MIDDFESDEKIVKSTEVVEIMVVNSMWRAMFPLKNRPAIIGMIHVKPLPGSPNYKNASYDEIVDAACQEAETYKNANLDGVLIENMHDRPYCIGNKVGPDVVAGMTRVATEVKKLIGNMKCGIQILAAANHQSLAVANATGCDFIRVEGFVFSHIADEGPVHACAGSLLRYRKAINAEKVTILTDIKKKHSSHAITQDVDEIETCKAAEFFQSDGIIITGLSTGHAPMKNLVQDVQKAVNIPVIVGSGITIENVKDYINCDGLIIGSYFKKNRKWEMNLETSHVNSFMEKIYHNKL